MIFELHDYICSKIIWLGDLNYRLTGSGSGDTQELLDKNDWQALLQKDQLRVEQRAGRVFGGWEEGQISFPPTYKYLADSDTYAAAAAFTSSASKKRTPAWYVNVIKFLLPLLSQTKLLLLCSDKLTNINNPCNRDQIGFS
jgi:hypothetical protein